MTFGGWQEDVQTEFALDIYQQFWPGCEIHENDSYGKKEETARLLDFGDVDKIICISGIQKQMAQRFRKPYNDGVQPDFTLRYSRPTSDKTIEYERLMKGYDEPGCSYPPRYSFGRVYPDHSKGIYEMFILDTDKLIEGIKDGTIRENGPIPVQGGQEMMAYSMGQIRAAGAVVKEWCESDEDTKSQSPSDVRPERPHDITEWA